MTAERVRRSLGTKSLSAARKRREAEGGHSINSMKAALRRLSQKEGPEGVPAIAKPGEKVICVDDRFSGQVWEWTTALPSLWRIYTVQDVK
ncbi:MAG: hypothetical protein ACO3NW_04490, partial [Kiritimatiellia bacterium]